MIKALPYRDNLFKDTKALAKWASSPTPTRTTDYHNHHFNSDKWDLVPLRKGDIVIATFAKSGTTWSMAIVGFLLLNKGLYPPLGEDEALLNRMPWVDMRIIPVVPTKMMVESQPLSRVLKTHLPLDGLAYNPNVKYIEVVRDPRDVLMSVLHHWCTFKESFLTMANMDPFRAGPPIPKCVEGKVDANKYFSGMLQGTTEGDNWLWSYWQHVSTWWAYRHLDNVHIVHYSNLKKDFEGELKRIAKFLEIEAEDELVAKVKEQTSLENMRTSSNIVQDVDAFFEGGKQSFINKGTNQRWKEVLKEDDMKLMEKIAAQKLPADCWHFLKTGELPAIEKQEL